jgi:hypothetical protein
MPTLYDDLSLRLTAASGAAEMVSGSRNPGLTLNEPVAASRAALRHVLASWAGTVCQERGINPPPTGEIHAVAPFLATHTDWLAHQGPDEDPLARLAYDEITDLRSRAFGLAYPSGRKRFAAAPCTRSSCPGTLFATIVATDSLLPSSLDCDTCDLALTADQWLRLGRTMRTAFDIAAVLRVPVHTVWRWASEDEWRRSDLRIRPILYRTDDAWASYQRRHGTNHGVSA